MKHFLALIILLTSTLALAGGRSEAMLITTFDRLNAYEAKLTIESEKGFFGCHQAKLFLNF